MLILRIRQAECAMEAGRLEEALALVASDKLRSHRRGQEAITRLIELLVARGREHLAAGRSAAAVADCERAARLGGELPAVAALRSEIADAQLAQHHAERQVAVAVAQAKRHLDDGQLSLGQRYLTGIEHSTAQRLMTEFNDQRARLESALAAIRSAIERGDWNAAADAVARARNLAGGEARLAELSGVVVKALSEQARAAINAGRLDHAILVARRMLHAAPDVIEALDLEGVLEQCRQAWQSIQAGRPRDAAEVLRRAKVALRDCGWVDEALDQLRAMDQALSELRGGPLSLLAEVTRASPNESPARKTTARSGSGSGMAVSPPAPGAALPQKFLLQVDGAGSFLVIRSAVVTIGPVSASIPPDVGLLADATTANVTFERLEEDYFLKARVPVAVNDRSATETLLTGGERIALSPRCRVSFARPHPASTTAAVDLVGARYPRSDVRRVILLDRDLVLGPASHCHVRVPGLEAPFVLQLRGDALRCGVEATADGKPVPREGGLPLNQPIEAGSARFVLSAAL